MAREPVLVVSSSEWLARRARRALEPIGYGVDRVPDPGRLARIRRQRPYHLCLLDLRRNGAWNGLDRSLGERPSERYVVLVGAWRPPVPAGALGGRSPYGYLREPFHAEELRAWVRRAEVEGRLARGDRTLEDLLHGRFQHFLRDLGPESLPSLHDLIWQQVERPLIASVLEWTGGNQSRAARVLGIHRNTLRSKIRKLGIPARQD